MKKTANGAIHLVWTSWKASSLGLYSKKIRNMLGMVKTTW
jgi:hypothetical protein